MDVVKRVDYYFVKPGSQNTEYVIEAVVERLKEIRVEKIVVASTSGETAVKLCRALNSKAKVIAISYEKMKGENIEELRKYGAEIIEDTYITFDKKVRDTLYTLGQGFKVAVEVALISVDKGLAKEGEEVIAIGGTDKGADTAIVVKAASSEGMIGSDPRKRLEVREIIALPMLKKWWE